METELIKNQERKSDLANEPINPTFFKDGELNSYGLTKREYFAALAMQGLISSCNWNVSVFGESLVKATSKNAVELADELLKQLES